MKAKSFVVAVCFCSCVASAYEYVRDYAIDGRPYRLPEGQSVVDLKAMYPNASADQWAELETVVTSDCARAVRLYRCNEWYGQLLVNGKLVRESVNGNADSWVPVYIDLMAGENRIVFRSKAGNMGWHCGLAFDDTRIHGKPIAHVDFGKSVGKVRRELHSAGFCPTICGCPQSRIDQIRALNLSGTRTHDWALLNANERVCDIHHIFPMQHLDAKDPKSYHFAPTDYLLIRTRDLMGLNVFYRLGTSIEHSGDMVHFNALIPGDFDKMAEEFAGIVRHYNHGWADGFHWNVKYWEIWNEPDGRNNMWCLPEGDVGSDQVARDERRLVKFVDFYIKCLKRLKSEFTDIKVGGPALCKMDADYFRRLLEACRTADVAPDFISWHYYGTDVDEILSGAKQARRLCDAYGFGKCELILDEWHYQAVSAADFHSVDPAAIRRVWEGPSANNGPDSAAFTLAALARFQDSSLDQSYYYGCSYKGDWGVLDCYGRPNKCYFALKAFGEVVKGYPILGEVRQEGLLTTLVAKTEDGRGKVLLAVDRSGSLGDVFLSVDGLGSAVVRKALAIDEALDLEPVDAVLADGMLRLPKRHASSAAYLVTFEIGDAEMK